jgi:hypothetical protein
MSSGLQLYDKTCLSVYPNEVLDGVCDVTDDLNGCLCVIGWISPFRQVPKPLILDMVNSQLSHPCSVLAAHYINSSNPHIKRQDRVLTTTPISLSHSARQAEENALHC